MAIERARDEHPTDGAWRADALGQSRHSRWTDELRAPLDNRDPERAAEICAEVTRRALRDFAPALILLDEADRRRAQALGAFALTLFDFALQTGLEGERLSQINRLEFDLEAALDGDPPGQPVFVALASAGAWPREALDELISAARRRVSRPRAENADEIGRDAEALGAALARALTNERNTAATTLAAGLLRLSNLLSLAESVRRRRPTLPRAAYPEDWLRGAPRPAELERPIQEECVAIREALSQADPARLPEGPRRAARYLRIAGLKLAAAAAQRGGALVEGAPQLGALTRIGLLARAWLRG